MTTNLPQTNRPASAPGTRELTFAAVQEIIADCLAVEIAEITPQARFFEALDGESIELLELSFRFEKEFKIQVPYKAFNNREMWEVDESGQLTEGAREIMRRDFAYLELERRFAESGSQNPRDLLTIDLMYQMLLHEGQK
jgi:acyl carrier protein